MKRSKFNTYGPLVLVLAGCVLAIVSIVRPNGTERRPTTTLAPTTSTTSLRQEPRLVVPSIQTLNELALCVHSAAIECHVDVEDGELAVYGTYPNVVSGPSTVRVHCQEDDPCWDCKRMGNHVCGVRP